MKTRIAAIIIALMALISTAQAEDYSVYVAGVQVTSSNKDDLSGIAGVSVGTDGYIKYSATYNALYLKNVTINLPITNYNPGIQNKNTGLKIYFYGENNITTYMMPAMMLTAQTELTSGSSGKAVLTSNSNAGLTCNSACNISNVSLECHGMSNGIDGNSTTDLTITDSKVEAWGSSSNTSHAIANVKSLSIKGCSTVTLHGNNSSSTMENTQQLTLDDMSITQPSGAQYVQSAGTIKVSNSAVTGDIKFTCTAPLVNSTNFPDTKFKTFVSTNIDTNGDGYLVSSERSVKTINVDGAGIYNLRGIKLFTKLNTLSCNNNYLSTLDVSGLPLTRLECNNNRLTKLTMTGCSSLNYLYCEQNKLSSLSLSELNNLKGLHCNDNQLTSIGNISGKTSLGELFCQNNKLSSVLDLTGCTTLSTIHCDNNQLTALYAPACKDLRVLICNDNKLTTLNITGCSQLQQVICKNNLLTSLDLYGCNLLREVQCQNNKLTSINIASGSSSYLGEFYCYGNQLKGENMLNIINGVKYGGNLWVYDNTDAWEQNRFTKKQYSLALRRGLTPRYADGTLYTGNDDIEVDDEYFPDDVFRTYVSINCDNGDGYLYPDEQYAVTVLNLNDKLLQSLKGIEYFPNLKELYCNDNNLSGKLDLSKHENLEILQCSKNQITSISNGSLKLKTVYVHDNQIKGLQMAELLMLICVSNATDGELRLIDKTSPTEENEEQRKNIYKAQQKGWNVYYYNGSEWAEYSEGLPTDIGTIGAEATADQPAYNLNGQAVGSSYRGIVVRGGRKEVKR